jgi:hypothetical protein
MLSAGRDRGHAVGESGRSAEAPKGATTRETFVRPEACRQARRGRRASLLAETENAASRPVRAYPSGVATPAQSPEPGLAAKPGALGELALTLPVFILYQAGVVFLRVRNATDIVTAQLLAFARGDRVTYLELTAGLGAGLFVIFAVLGHGQVLRGRKLIQIAIEGAAYAIAMGSATSWVVGRLFAGPPAAAVNDPFTGVVMSLGAGFYEELAFRVLLFGIGAKVLVWLFARQVVSLIERTQTLGLRAIGVMIVWAFASAAVFSGMHYVGPLGDPFDARSFVARAVLGLALTLVYATRGFAAAVWTHALYDMWVLLP